jgi:hypothetical protein
MSWPATSTERGPERLRKGGGAHARFSPVTFSFAKIEGASENGLSAQTKPPQLQSRRYSLPRDGRRSPGKLRPSSRTPLGTLLPGGLASKQVGTPETKQEGPLALFWRQARATTRRIKRVGCLLAWSGRWPFIIP